MPTFYLHHTVYPQRSSFLPSEIAKLRSLSELMEDTAENLVPFSHMVTTQKERTQLEEMIRICLSVSEFSQAEIQALRRE